MEFKDVKVMRVQVGWGHAAQEKPPVCLVLEWSGTPSEDLIDESARIVAEVLRTHTSAHFSNALWKEITKKGE